MKTLGLFRWGMGQWLVPAGVIDAAAARLGALALSAVLLAPGDGLAAPLGQSTEQSQTPIQSQIRVQGGEALSLDMALRCLDAETGRKAATSQPQERARVWALLSPRMPYSLLEWPRMQREAEAAGFEVHAWRDPAVPELEWQLAMASTTLAHWDVPQPLDMPSACEWIWAGANHFPMVQVLWGVHRHSWPVWGVLPSQAWLDSLDFRLRLLKTNPNKVSK